MNIEKIRKKFSVIFNNNDFTVKKITKLSNYIVKKYLDDKKSKGFIILKNLSVKDYEKKFLILAKSIGKLRVQNSLGSKIIKVTPGKNVNQIKNQLVKKRYHQTNIGGSIHTDGPQLSKTPRYLLMGCFKNSKKGGESLISDAKKIFLFIKKNKPEFLKELTQNIYFERRGFKYKNNNCFKKPIFTVKKRKIIFRYLKEYIFSAYKINKKNLSANLLNSLNYLDFLLMKKKFQDTYKLKDGEIILIDNHRLAHGRNKFTLDNSASRLIYRVWVG